MKKLLCILCVLTLLCVSAYAETAGLANPWKDMTAEELEQASGFAFVLPEGAENSVFRYLEAESLAEVQFTLNGMAFNARIKPAAAFEDISGLHYEVWDVEEDCDVNGLPGRAQRTADGDNTVDLCLWWDEPAGIMYALTTAAPDLDGFDIEAIAEMMTPKK